MLHSKIYFFEMPEGTATAFVGSHNLTGFALRGLNGEAAVLLEGPSSDPVFDEIRSHIAESYRQAVPYDTSLKEAYARWFHRTYISGIERGARNPTVLVLDQIAEALGVEAGELLKKS